MINKKYFTIISCFCLTLQASVFAFVENSVVPLVEKYEQIENIPAEKLSDNHYNEIKNALSHIDQKVRLVTYNLLCDDRETQSQEINKWRHRLPRVVELFKEMQPDLICVQEQYQHQLDAWLPQLCNFAFYGSPRGDGEVNGVAYRKDRFELLESSVTIIPGSRIKHNTITMIQLKDLQTGHKFAVFNTHLTYSSNNERELEALFITELMTQISKQMPVMLTGDLNTFPCRFDEKFPYFDGDYVHRVFTKKLLKDSQEVALLGHLGPVSTFTNAIGNGIPFKGLGTPGVILDHIYVDAGINVLMHAIQPGTVEGCFPSDHMPVFIDFLVNEKH